MDAKAISMLKVEGAAYCYRKVESSMLHGYDRNMSNSIYHIYPILLKACKSKNMGDLSDRFNLNMFLRLSDYF